MNDADEIGTEILAPTSAVLEAINRSEIDQQMTVARKFPRSVKTFMESVATLATLNEHTAQQCVYSIPRDGKRIAGPSVRFAEILVSSWGHARAAARVVSIGDEFITAQGVFHDLQSNMAITMEVQRRITGKNGKRYSADMIAVTGNAACSIALRNAILRGIPKALWQDTYQKVERVIAGDERTLTKRRIEAVRWFVEKGAKRERVFAALGVKGMDDVTMEHLILLAGFRTALDEGAVIDDVFPPTDSEVPASDQTRPDQSQPRPEKSDIKDDKPATKTADTVVAVQAQEGATKIVDAPVEQIPATGEEDDTPAVMTREWLEEQLEDLATISVVEEFDERVKTIGAKFDPNSELAAMWVSRAKLRRTRQFPQSKK
jgi:hypothetical protein